MPALRGFRERALAVSERINDRSDAITSLLREAEEEIGRWSLGVSVFIDDEPLEMQLHEDGPSLVTEELGWARLNGAWRLVARSAVSGEKPAYKKVRPLEDCTPELRLAAVDVLPRLVERLLETAEDRVSEVEHKATRMAELVGQLRG